MLSCYSFKRDKQKYFFQQKVFSCYSFCLKCRLSLLNCKLFFKRTRAFIQRYASGKNDITLTGLERLNNKYAWRHIQSINVCSINKLIAFIVYHEFDINLYLRVELLINHNFITFPVSHIYYRDLDYTLVDETAYQCTRFADNFRSWLSVLQFFPDLIRVKALSNSFASQRGKCAVQRLANKL